MPRRAAAPRQGQPDTKGGEPEVRVKLLFVDGGSYHHETLTVPARALEGYERLIDCLREEPSVLARVYVDVDRLCAAYRADDEA